MANSRSGESVLHRIVKVIGAFDDTRPATSVSAIAHRAGMPVSTAYRLVADLESERLLQRTETGELQLGLRLWELVTRGSSVLALREAALPFMEDVFSVVRQHTTLGVRDGAELLYTERIGAGSSALSVAKVARRLPVCACSSGMVLLAHAPSAVQNEILARPAKQCAGGAVTAPAALRRHLAHVRQVGYSVMKGAIVPESTGIAVPVFGPRDDIVAALSVIVPNEEANVAAHVPVLKTAALGISRALGRRRT